MVLKVLNYAENIKGGVATYLNNIDSSKKDLNIETFFFVPYNEKEELSIYPKNDHRIFYHLGKRSVFKILKNAYWLYKILKKIKPDIIFVHSTFAAFSFCLLSFFFKIKIKTVYCPHGWASFKYSSEWKKNIVLLLERFIAKRFDKVINISKYEHSYTEKKNFPNNSVLIENSVKDSLLPFEQKKNKNEKRLNFLFVGRLDYQKGYDILIQAFQILLDRGIDFRLDVVGQPVLNDLEIVDNVSNKHGWISNENLDAIYKGADFLIMPSRYEGFGLTAIEALRNGTPLILSNIGSLKDFVAERNCGYLFDNNSESLSHTLSNIDGKNLDVLSRNARENYLKNYSYSSFLEKLRNVLHERE